jgi:hypothetical protein
MLDFVGFKLHACCYFNDSIYVAVKAMVKINISKSIFY